jgi:hypothetical protein
MARPSSPSTVLRAWLALSVLWVAGVIYGESLDGLLFQELGEVIATALIPPLLPLAVFSAFMWVIVDLDRP